MSAHEYVNEQFKQKFEEKFKGGTAHCLIVCFADHFYLVFRVMYHAYSSHRGQCLSNFFRLFVPESCIGAIHRSDDAALCSLFILTPISR